MSLRFFTVKVLKRFESMTLTHKDFDEMKNLFPVVKVFFNSMMKQTMKILGNLSHVVQDFNHSDHLYKMN